MTQSVVQKSSGYLPKSQMHQDIICCTFSPSPRYFWQFHYCFMQWCSGWVWYIIFLVIAFFHFSMYLSILRCWYWDQKYVYNVESEITARRIASFWSVVSFSKIVFLILKNGPGIKPPNSFHSFIIFLTVFWLLPDHRAVALMTLKDI